MFRRCLPPVHIFNTRSEVPVRPAGILIYAFKLQAEKLQDDSGLYNSG